VALIDTEGQKAIDVFYLTEHGKKTQPAKKRTLARSAPEYALLTTRSPLPSTRGFILARARLMSAHSNGEAPVPMRLEEVERSE